MVGYSGTPLAKKLGLKEQHLIAVLNAPDGFIDGTDFPMGCNVQEKLGKVPLDVVICFVTLKAQLQAAFPKAAARLKPEGGLWIAWPKLSARKKGGPNSDMTEDAVRAVAFPQGFVDNKVCAIDDVWSGLRCVLRIENRPKRKL